MGQAERRPEGQVQGVDLDLLFVALLPTSGPRGDFVVWCVCVQCVYLINDPVPYHILSSSLRRFCDASRSGSNSSSAAPCACSPDVRSVKSSASLLCMRAMSSLSFCWASASIFRMFSVAKLVLAACASTFCSATTSSCCTISRFNHSFLILFILRLEMSDQIF
jgi:hypothetical protein